MSAGRAARRRRACPDPDLGQGACLAPEDAVTLAASANRQADVPAALAAYDQARRSRTQRLVRVSAQFGRIAQWQGPLATRLREALAGLTPAGVYLRASAETLSWSPPTPRAPDQPAHARR